MEEAFDLHGLVGSRGRHCGLRYDDMDEAADVIGHATRSSFACKYQTMIDQPIIPLKLSLPLEASLPPQASTFVVVMEFNESIAVFVFRISYLWGVCVADLGNRVSRGFTCDGKVDPPQLEVHIWTRTVRCQAIF